MSVTFPTPMPSGTVHLSSRALQFAVMIGALVIDQPFGMLKLMNG